MKKLLTQKTSLVVLILCILLSCNKKQPADMVVFGGKIYTASDKRPIVEAVAVKGNKIVFTGSEKDARNLIGDKRLL